MRINKKDFILHLNKFFLYEKNPIIAVAVSGGPDSIALAYLMDHWIKLKKGKIIALLIDHKIRKESYDECKLTQKYLNKLRIESRIIRIANQKLKKNNMGEARANRFEKLIFFCKKNKILHLFLGHHFDDNLETFLLRKIACSNLEGLGSIPTNIIFNKIQIIRPLLKHTKKEIIEFLKLNKINYITDPSNFDEKYSRGLIRKFLKKTNHINKIKKDFDMIVKYVPYYKLMINEIMHKLLLKINTNKIIFSISDFNRLDFFIKEKIIEKIYVYFQLENKQLRYSKIRKFLYNLEDSQCNSYNLSSMKVIKDSNFLTFLINK